MQLSAIYKILYDFVVWAVDNPAVTVTQGYQTSNTRGLKPLVIFNIGNYRTSGSAMYYEIDDNGIQQVGLNKIFTVTFNAFSDTLHQSEQLLNDVKDRIYTNNANVNFFKEDIAPRVVTLGVNSLPRAISNTNESRAILEVTFGTTDIILDDVGLIEHIVIESIDGSEIIVNK